MTALEKKILEISVNVISVSSTGTKTKNRPEQYVKTKRGTELFFHTACLESLARMNKRYLNGEN